MVVRRLALVICLALLVAVHVLPDGVVPAQDAGLDLTLHVAMFLGLGLLVAWNFPDRQWLILLSGVLLGSLLEAAQAFIPGRSADVHDLVGNWVGTALALGLVSAWGELHRVTDSPESP